MMRRAALVLVTLPLACSVEGTEAFDLGYPEGRSILLTVVPDDDLDRARYFAMATDREQPLGLELRYDEPHALEASAYDATLEALGLEVGEILQETAVRKPPVPDRSFSRRYRDGAFDDWEPLVEPGLAAQRLELPAYACPTIVNEPIPISPPARNEFVFAAEGVGGDVWFGAKRSVHRYRDRQIEQIYVPDKNISHGVFAHDRLWLADEDGVYVVDPLDPSAPVERFAASADVIGMAASPNLDEVWVAAQNGSVSMHDGTEWLAAAPAAGVRAGMSHVAWYAPRTILLTGRDSAVARVSLDGENGLEATMVNRIWTIKTSARIGGELLLLAQPSSLEGERVFYGRGDDGVWTRRWAFVEMSEDIRAVADAAPWVVFGGTGRTFGVHRVPTGEECESFNVSSRVDRILRIGDDEFLVFDDQLRNGEELLLVRLVFDGPIR